jgi:lysyl-tRNA synthetase class 1
MGLVTLADEYERLAARDFDKELANDELSRRQRVQIEDAAGALRMASTVAGGKAQATAVTFRHLALLAQTKKNDEDVWSSLQSSGAIGAVTPELEDRLSRMRHWIHSRHFPAEMRITILEQPNLEMLKMFDDDEKKILANMTAAMEACDWDSQSIGASIPQAARDLDLSPRSAFKVAYAALMGAEKGPRLAPILAEMEKQEILVLLRACLTSITE